MKRAEAKLLVADDSSTMRLCVCWLLRQQGIRQVDEAANGAIGFSMFRRKRYDLVITDWAMPLVDGLDFLRAVRGGNLRNDTPVLMLTTSSEQGSLHEAIAAGATGFVPKPRFNPSLTEQVVNLLAMRPRSGRKSRSGSDSSVELLAHHASERVR